MRKLSDKVYVIGNRGVPTVKIGIAVDVERRLAEIANGWCPWRIDRSALIALRVYETSAARRMETALHAAFAPLRLRRLPGDGTPVEWFRFGAGAPFLIDGRVAQLREDGWV